MNFYIILLPSVALLKTPWHPINWILMLTWHFYASVKLNTCNRLIEIL